MRGAVPNFVNQLLIFAEITPDPEPTSQRIKSEGKY